MRRVGISLPCVGRSFRGADCSPITRVEEPSGDVISDTERLPDLDGGFVIPSLALP